MEEVEHIASIIYIMKEMKERLTISWFFDKYSHIMKYREAMKEYLWVYTLPWTEWVKGLSKETTSILDNVLYWKVYCKELWDTI